MARMSGVPFLGIADNGLMTRHDIICLHTIVGYQSGGNAAHWTTGASGRIVQARDTIYRSAANLNGNWHVLAIENEDHGPAFDWSDGPPPFTAAQCEANAKILAWGHRVHGIPLVLVPDSKVGRRGIAYHRQGIDGNFTGPYRGRVAGGELWSSAFGKVCPGDPRIRQLITIIIPRARVLAGIATEDDVSAAEVWGWENPKLDDRDMRAYLVDACRAAEKAQAIATVNQQHIYDAEADAASAKAASQAANDKLDALSARFDELITKLGQ